MPFEVVDENDDMTQSTKIIDKVQQSLKLNIPGGYIPINLSTKGKLGVPEIIHVKNFNTENLIDLSMASDELLPERLIHLLKDLILEPVKVEEWPEKAVVELLIKIYANFFTPLITSTDFPWNQEDLDWLKAHGQEEQANNLIAGKWKPKVDVDLRNVKIKDFPSEVKSYVTIKNRFPKNDPSYVEVKFLAYTRIGDSLALKKAADDKFEKEDLRFEKIKQLIDLREARSEKGSTDLPVIPEKEFLDWQLHNINKAIYMSKLSKALYIVAFNGIDLSKSTIEEKLKYSEDPRLDVNITKKVDTQFSKLDFGIDPNIELKNPITKEVCTRRFSFRLLDILQAIRLSDSDEYDISYDD